MGWINQNYGPGRVLPFWATLPAMVAVIFIGILRIERTHGGYRAPGLA
jgi:hypothetical protein